jgi:GMP synthase (glutamine-hydrolysing)
VLANNAMSPFQAMEIRHDGGLFHGVQYHPEFSLTELASIMRRMAPLMVEEGRVRTPDEALAYTGELMTLDRDRTRRDIAWRLGLDDEVIDDARRTRELRNWIEAVVQPAASRRGRG